MRVTHGGSDLLVTHHLLDSLEVYPLNDQVRAESVPQVVEAEVLYLGPLQSC